MIFWKILEEFPETRRLCAVAWCEGFTTALLAVAAGFILVSAMGWR